MPKLYISFDQCRTCALWLVKACLLILDFRITRRIPKQHIAIKVIIVYVVAGFTVLEICYYFVWCWPFSNKWLNPTGQCGVPTHHLIMEAVFNISSDIALMAVMIPMIIFSGLPRKETCYVCGLFGLGVFVVFCAAASKYYVFMYPSGERFQCH